MNLKFKQNFDNDLVINSDLIDSDLNTDQSTMAINLAKPMGVIKTIFMFMQK